MSGEYLKILSKAERLIEEGRVVRISSLMFYVIGDHGKYFVYVEDRGVKCNCPGFRKRGFCSHAIAILLLILRKEYRDILEEGLRKRLQEQLNVIKQGIYPR
ncbi:MAG: hypothetical protein DRJ64_05125 [Thermoprotei archaeon]|nr:MAG: hypothetical protein DRJ64_05125 [Thermoprotei archaeon]